MSGRKWLRLENYICQILQHTYFKHDFLSAETVIMKNTSQVRAPAHTRYFLILTSLYYICSLSRSVYCFSTQRHGDRKNKEDSKKSYCNVRVWYYKFCRLIIPSSWINRLLSWYWTVLLQRVQQIASPLPGFYGSNKEL